MPVAVRLRLLVWGGRWCAAAASLRFPEAMEALQAAEALLPLLPKAPGSGPATPPPPEGALLSKMRYEVAECAGDYALALDFLGDALAAEAVARTPPSSADLRRLFDVLHRVASDPDTPPSRAAALYERANATVAALLASGPWVSPRQLPATFLRVPGLLPVPWFSASTYPHPALGDIAAAMVAAAPALRAEFAALDRAGRLSRDVECIHSRAGGQWRAFSVGAPWHEQPGLAPAAAGLLARLASFQPLPILRAEYSALDAGGVILPHFGMTNGEGGGCWGRVWGGGASCERDCQGAVVGV
jgi:hypothetical protein